MVGANGMMMSAEEWYDVGNYEIKGNAFPHIALNLEPLTCLASHPCSCMPQISFRLLSVGLYRSVVWRELVLDPTTYNKTTNGIQAQSR